MFRASRLVITSLMVGKSTLFFNKHQMILLIFLPIVLYAGILEDLDDVVQYYDCDLKCTFNHSEMTSETIKFFPKNCTNICGILVFNSKTDLSENEIVNLFMPVLVLSGGMRVENSSFTSLGFLSYKGLYFRFLCDRHGMVIANNHLLTDVSVLEGFLRLSGENGCKFNIENNTALDTCWLGKPEVFTFFIDLVTRGNLKDCTCRYNSSEPQQPTNCKALKGGLNITGITNSSDLSFLTSIEKIMGNLEIGNTNLKNISFLKNLKIFESANGGMNYKVSVNIHDNYEMTRLGLESVETLIDLFHGPFLINLENLHPDFCITFREWRIFLENYVEFHNLKDAKLCQELESAQESDFVFCNFTSMAVLPIVCQVIVGDVIIDANDGQYLKKLMYISYIFGTLKVQYTKADGLEFLTGLEYIVSLDEGKAPITIRSNKYLKDARLPYIKHIISKNEKSVVIYDNPILFENNEHCKMYQLTFNTNLKIENGDCEKRVYKTSHLLNLFLIFSLISLIVFTYL
ncbi:Receptor L-domain domain-containing protein [Caenorhabditis elegans]|uniref:Receptor L-domain domain-containing protein n=1 Tax=Caenorhabditis elegans TaxID=6239 RepID=Q9U3D2_CAEEL|nr:Receptor L-domain domain-containing protein [Caenorhabditis elegans]CAB63231.1 Receptor L-domain domain-containing protein [Caenorhabditis elegans]|eukprot:NP_502924.1 High Performance in Advanced age [Caenorhabditis elegans]